MKGDIKEMAMKFGKIRGWNGEPTDGMGLLILEDLATGDILYVPCETSPTFRAFQLAFPDTKSIIGKNIGYETDELGIMTEFRVEGEDD
jgi:hypothetical protein